MAVDARATGGDGVKLIADAMLGRLARWLRALGYDTLYDANLDDLALARRARAEGRVILTRDRELAARKGLRSVLVASDRLPEQLQQVLCELPPSATAAFARCVACNGVLVEVDRASVEARVPEYVWETQDVFMLCRGCGRIYWRGTHWRSMLDRLGLAQLNRSCPDKGD